MTVRGFSQTPKQTFVLDAPEQDATRSYKARLYIRLKNNFRYTAVNGNSFRAYIDPDFPISIKAITNASPDSITNPSNDGAYIPGGTFGSDILNGKTRVPVNRNDNGLIPVFTYPALWFKTIPLTNNLNGYYYWKEITGDKASLRVYTSSGQDEVLLTPKPGVRSFNFNPSIDFSSITETAEIKIKDTDLGQVTLMGVWAPKQDYNTDQFVFAIHGRKDESIIFTKDTIGEPVGARESFAYGTNNQQSLLFKNRGTNDNDSTLFKERAPRIATVCRLLKPNLNIWGESANSVINIGGVFDTTKINQVSSFSPSWQNYIGFKGYAPELLVFNRMLSEDERNIFETYLAIKYGLTLNKSYVNGRNQLIWDYTANSTYNNRITAYARDNALGLNQKMSTTSYEEKPYFSTSESGDSFESYDSYKLSGSGKLLVAGTQPGNSLLDGEYFIFGDNNDSIQETISLINGYKVLKRRWKLLSNTNDIRPYNDMAWVFSNLIKEDTNSPFVLNFVKNPSSTNGFARTNTILQGDDGYLSWVVGLEYGPVKAKFGTSEDVFNLNNKGYGYDFNVNGDVKKIIRDSVLNYSLFTVEKNHKIEIEKCGRLIYLRVNGVRYKETEILLDSADIHKPYYGQLIFGSNTAGEVRLDNFRYGGFSNTGNKIELSYLNERAAIFQPCIEDKNVYMLINRNGDNHFLPGINNDLAIIQCDEIDSLRSKIIFNNVFFSNNNIFTFGYRSQEPSNINKRTQYQEEPELIDDIKIYYKNPRDQQRLTVRIQTAEVSPASVYVFDVSGRLIYRNNLLESNEIRFVDVELPGNGVYVVKVLTKDMRYTKKVISSR